MGKRRNTEHPPDPVDAATARVLAARAARDEMQARVRSLEEAAARALSDTIQAEDTGDETASASAATVEDVTNRQLSAARRVLVGREEALTAAQAVLRQAEAAVALDQLKLLQDAADADNVEASAHIEAAVNCLGAKREKQVEAHGLARVHQLGHVRESRLLLSKSVILSPLGAELRAALSPLRAGVPKDQVREETLRELAAEP